MSTAVGYCAPAPTPISTSSSDPTYVPLLTEGMDQSPLIENKIVESTVYYLVPGVTQLVRQYARKASENSKKSGEYAKTVGIQLETILYYYAKRVYYMNYEKELKLNDSEVLTRTDLDHLRFAVKISLYVNSAFHGSEANPYTEDMMVYGAGFHPPVEEYSFKGGVGALFKHGVVAAHALQNFFAYMVGKFESMKNRTYVESLYKRYGANEALPTEYVEKKERAIMVANKSEAAKAKAAAPTPTPTPATTSTTATTSISPTPTSATTSTTATTSISPTSTPATTTPNANATSSGSVDDDQYVDEDDENEYMDEGDDVNTGC